MFHIGSVSCCYTEVDGAQDIPLGDVSSDKRRLIRSRECNGEQTKHTNCSTVHGL